MSFDPSVTLALSMAAGPGQYALLLGSGVSRSAGIPTGWEVTLNLISKIARATDGEAPANPNEWWCKHRLGAPQYSTLLEELAPCPSERSQLLRDYFEPTDDEREANLKAPAPAHRAIARLVAAGVVRVIITTNFDRLLEQAIQDKGIAPVILSTPDQAAGASPLVHNRCAILKVNGDYQDAHTKNTEAELGSYDPPIDMLLDRILDEYGLVVCGWSAEWDTGLRAAIERAKNRRYTTYWADPREPGAAAADLIDLRQAVRIQIPDADQFFEDLADRVSAVQESGDDPEAVTVAIAQLKRYLSRRRYRIRYGDFMRGATGDLVRATSDDQFSVSDRTNQIPAVAARARHYEQLANRVTHLVASAAYLGEESHEAAIDDVVRRLTEAHHDRSRQSALPNVGLYPALLAMYASGIAMIARDKFVSLRSILALSVTTENGQTPIFDILSPNAVLPPGVAKALCEPQLRADVSASDVLHGALRQPFIDLIHSDDEYATTFDSFEYLLALVESDWGITSGKGRPFPVRRFAWRHDAYSPAWLPNLTTTALERDGTSWPPLLAGMFDGDMTRLRVAKAKVDDWAKSAQ